MGLTVESEHPVGHCFVSAVTGEHVTVSAVNSPEMNATNDVTVSTLIIFEMQDQIHHHSNTFHATSEIVANHVGNVDE